MLPKSHTKVSVPASHITIVNVEFGLLHYDDLKNKLPLVSKLIIKLLFVKIIQEEIIKCMYLNL